MITAVVAIALATAAAVLWRRHRYARVFRIPTTRDDVFVCRGGSALTVVLDARGCAIAEPPRAGSTVLLEFTLRSSIVGTLFDPHVAHAAGRQFFERGVRGRRYLNLSPLFAERAPDRLELRARHLRWHAHARLLVFDAPNLADRSRLVIAPHPDDAELAAFGLYADAPSFVLTISAGERSSVGTDAAEHAALRVEASLTIPGLGGRGREHCANLVFPDARLMAMHDDRSLACELACEPRLTRCALRARNSQPQLAGGAATCRWADLVSELATIIRSHRPDIVVCPHPLLDAHPDHVYTAVATAEALAACGHRPESVLLYAVHALNAPLHPIGDHSDWVSLPPGAPAPWIADSIYSHALTQSMRAAKHRAIELAPDLRPREAPRGAVALLVDVLRRCAALVSGLPREPGSLLRRNSRPNEIYFAVTADGLAELANRAAGGGSPVHGHERSG